MQRLTTTLFALVVVSTACSCGGTPPPPPPAPVLTTLTLSPSPLQLAERQTQVLTATVLDQTGAKMEVPILWASSDPAVAVVTDSGLVVAVEAGQALVWARAHFLLETIPVTVVEPLDVRITGATTSASGLDCVYTLSAVASGGAPGDSATFAASTIELLDPTGALTTIEVDTVQMLDRFGTLVMRRGDSLRTHELTEPQGAGTTIVNRVRYRVGAELKSARIPIICPTSTRPPGGGRAPR